MGESAADLSQHGADSSLEVAFAWFIAVTLVTVWGALASTVLWASPGGRA
jgi:hypothetical protein